MALLQQRVRSMGLYKPARKPVWVEWKSYRTELDQKSRNLMPVESDMRRIKGLVAVLHSHKLKAFDVPERLCHIDYREDVESGDIHHQADFGLVCEVLEDAVSDAIPPSLLDLIKTMQNDHPSLSQHMKLAHRTSGSVLYLHAVQWLHNSIRSDGIVFSPDVNTKKIELAEPRMAGF